MITNVEKIKIVSIALAAHSYLTWYYTLNGSLLAISLVVSNASAAPLLEHEHWHSTWFPSHAFLYSFAAALK
jgi:hypothetical protein